MIHGRNLIVSIDGTAIAGAKSCKLNLSQEFITACSPTDGRVMKKIPTTYDWGVSCDCLIPSSNLTVSLSDKLIAGTQVMITFTDGGSQRRFGYAYVKSCDQSGAIGSLAACSVVFESTGALYKYTQYTPQFFTEGEEWIMAITDNHIDLSKDRHSSILGVGITVTKASTLLVNCDSPWGLTQMSWNAAKESLAQDSGWQDIEQNEVACGDGNDSDDVSLQPGSYTFLCNDDAGIYGIGLTLVYQ